MELGGRGGTGRRVRRVPELDQARLETAESKRIMTGKQGKSPRTGRRLTDGQQKSTPARAAPPVCVSAKSLRSTHNRADSGQFQGGTQGDPGTGAGRCEVQLKPVAGLLGACGQASCWSMKAVSWALLSAPTLVAASCPSLNNMRVGMPRIPNLAGTSRFSSTFILATCSLPW